jgi:hypothetical protein
VASCVLTHGNLGTGKHLKRIIQKMCAVHELFDILKGTQTDQFEMADFFLFIFSFLKPTAFDH